MIYNKEPMQVLWDAVKSLAGEIEIYKEVMTEDENSTPESFVLLRVDITNSPLVYGDGAVNIRRCVCDLILVTKGTATASDSLHNINKAKVTAALDAAGLAYTGYNLGYDPAMNCTQYTWSVIINYGQNASV
jgi:hypothetical protein